jgi:hypothetical protein
LKYVGIVHVHVHSKHPRAVGRTAADGLFLFTKHYYFQRFMRLDATNRKGGAIRERWQVISGFAIAMAGNRRDNTARRSESFSVASLLPRGRLSTRLRAAIGDGRGSRTTKEAVIIIYYYCILSHQLDAAAETAG